MKKKFYLMTVLMSVVMILTACGAGTTLTPVNTEDTNKFSGELSIGDVVYEDMYSVVFAGMKDEVLIFNQAYESIYVPFETKEWVIIPYTDRKVKFKVLNIDKEKGTIEIELIDNQYN